MYQHTRATAPSGQRTIKNGVKAEHARRMFSEALDNDEAVAGHAMCEIQKLYAVERTCREHSLSFEEIKATRHEESVPVLKALGQWMKEQYMQCL